MKKQTAPTWLDAVVATHRHTGILLDTNILLLLLIGNYDRSLIATFKRTDTFTESDYVLLVDFLSAFATIHTTTHVLTELSNLSWNLPGSRLAEYVETFTAAITTLSEHHELSTVVTQHPSFAKFGLSDAFLADLAQSRLLLTEDFPLSNWVRSAGGHVINFNHIRTCGWM